MTEASSNPEGGDDSIVESTEQPGESKEGTTFEMCAGNVPLNGIDDHTAEEKQDEKSADNAPGDGDGDGDSVKVLCMYGMK